MFLESFTDKLLIEVMHLAEIIHSILVLQFCPGESISKDWQASVLCIQKTEFLKVLNLRIYRTSCLKFFILKFYRKSEKLCFVSWVTRKGHRVLLRSVYLWGFLANEKDFIECRVVFTKLLEPFAFSFLLFTLHHVYGISTKILQRWYLWFLRKVFFWKLILLGTCLFLRFEDRPWHSWGFEINPSKRSASCSLPICISAGRVFLLPQTFTRRFSWAGAPGLLCGWENCCIVM